MRVSQKNSSKLWITNVTISAIWYKTIKINYKCDNIYKFLLINNVSHVNILLILCFLLFWLTKHTLFQVYALERPSLTLWLLKGQVTQNKFIPAIIFSPYSCSKSAYICLFWWTERNIFRGMLVPKQIFPTIDHHKKSENGIKKCPRSVSYILQNINCIYWVWNGLNRCRIVYHISISVELTKYG